MFDTEYLILDFVKLGFIQYPAPRIQYYIFTKLIDSKLLIKFNLNDFCPDTKYLIFYT